MAKKANKKPTNTATATEVAATEVAATVPEVAATVPEVAATVPEVAATVPTPVEQAWHLAVARDWETDAFKKYSTPVKELMALATGDKVIDSCMVAMALHALDPNATQVAHSHNIGVVGVPLYKGKKEFNSFTSEAAKLDRNTYSQSRYYEYAQKCNRNGVHFQGKHLGCLAAFKGEFGKATLAYLAHKLGKSIDVDQVHSEAVAKFETAWVAKAA